MWHWDYGIYIPRLIEKEVQEILTNYFNLKLGKTLFIDKRYSKNKNSSVGYKAFFSFTKTY